MTSKRFTKEYDVITSVDKDGNEIHSKGIRVVNRALADKKLFEIENIEKELGIDSIKLLKASINGFYTLYIDGKVNPDKWEPWHFIVDMEHRCFRSLNMIGQLGQTRFYFNDYGKTWVLTKKEKEE